jgi:hypothetical protein
LGESERANFLKADQKRAARRAAGFGEEGKKPNSTGGTTVECLNYSEALNLIGFGGVAGKIGILDSTTVTFKGLFEAHAVDVESIYFHDKELLMITVAKDSEMLLWDA